MSPRCLIAVLALSVLAMVRTSAQVSAINPEIDRLWTAFGGNWNTTETMEHSQFFPNGGARHGSVTFRLVADGAVLVEEGHSDGSAGKLSFLITFWWDKDAKLYRMLTCFNSHNIPCRLRGTAHWDGDTFLNDYEELVDGKPTKFQDSFSHITPKSFILGEFMADDKQSMRPLITTRYTLH